jgi:ATP-dependent Lon protease
MAPKPESKYNTRNNKKNKLKKNDPDTESDDDYETMSESSESSYKPPKSKRSKKRIIESDSDEEESIGDEDSDDEEDEETDSDDEEFIDDEDEDDNVKRADIQQLISKMFPSKYMSEKVKNTKKLENKQKSNKKPSKSIKKTKRSKKDEESEEEESDDEDSDYDEKKDKFDIIFIEGGDEDEFEEEVYNDEDDRGDCDSDDEKMFMKEKYEAVEMPTKDDSIKKKSKKEQVKSKKSKKEESSSELNDVESEYLDLVETKKHLTNQLNRKPNNKVLINAVEECNRSIKKLVKKARIKNAKAYHKLIHDDKQNTNEVDYFKKNLSNKQQLRIMKDLKEINTYVNIDKPYRLALLESKIPAKLKAVALQKLNVLKYMDPGDNEYYKIKNWVDTFMRIPFGTYKSLSITMDDGVDKCHDFMMNAIDTLDNCVYGLNDAKMQIMQMVGQWISNPGALGTAIAIHGPPGTGKCHGYNTPILMYDGSIKMVQDVIVGDQIMGDDSTSRTVLSLGCGIDEMYEVISNKGIKYTVNSEHILCLKPSGLNRVKPVKNKNGTTSFKTVYFSPMNCKFKYQTFQTKEAAEKHMEELISTQETDIVEISVKEYFKLPQHIQESLKGYTTGVDFDSKPILFDPYIIGAWLGDGCSSKAQITNQDAAILSYMRTELKKDNLNLNYISKYDYSITSDVNNFPHPGISKTTGFEFENKNIFLETLRHYDLINNKHIPHDYKTNDRNTRLQILAGLLDTDGSFEIDNRCYSIIQKNKRLSDDIVFIARSLGFAATQTECDKYCVYNNEKCYGLYYNVTIYGDNINEIPIKCPRKQATYKPRQKNALVSNITIVPMGKGNYYGFELDNNHRYVLGNFTVTHNTSLVKEGISKILGREFTFIALGGAGDSSFLEGHSYTYEGSTWGKIVQLLIDSKCMNPVIYFDELDKISDTPRGEEIIGILTHLTDTSQNSQFHDKYFSDVDFDLSKCLFIFSYNDESKVNYILKDRMYRIKTKGYDAKEKIIIARDYILTKIREQVNFNEGDVIIPDETISYIASKHSLTNNESGVRNLKRCLEIIYTKLNLFRLMKPDSDNIFTKEVDLKVTFPFTVTPKEVDIFIKNEDPISQSMLAMYC